MLATTALAVIAALASVQTACANWLPYQNWGVAPNNAPSSQRSQCTSPGSFFISFAGQTYCVSKSAPTWKPDTDDDCPLQGWGWHSSAKW